MAQVAQMLQRKWATRSREGQYEIYLVGNRISQNLRETESRLNEEREKAMGAIEQADYPYVEDWWDEGEQLNIEIREEAKDEASGGFDEGYRHRRANAPFRDSVPFDDSTVGSIGSTERRIHGDYEKAHESDDDMDYENSGEEKQDCRHDDEDNEDVDMELVYSIFSHAINKEKVQVGEPPEPMSPCTPTEPLSP